MSDKQAIISIDEETGELRFVHNEQLADVVQCVGEITKQRATTIEPVNFAWRVLFRFIRKRVSDGSWLAGVTRRFPCKWEARLIRTGQTIATGWDRKKLIEAEVEFLNKHEI